MKIIHCADIHLGSKIDCAFPKEEGEKRKSAVRSTFNKLVSYAKQHAVKVILISGDLFDSDNPFKKDKDFFYSVVQSNPQIDFLYLRGNHDLNRDRDFTYPNLKTFSDSWTSYDYDNVKISGIEMTNDNCTSLYSTLNLPQDTINIVMLHGQKLNTESKDKNTFNILKLKDKNIDYLALGHLHSYNYGSIDERGIWAYSGCPEGRGFDETGHKGFVLLDIYDNKIEHTFIKFAENEIYEVEVDISNVGDAYSAYMKVCNEVELDRRNIYRIVLTGEVDCTIDDLIYDTTRYLQANCYFARVKDHTTKKLDFTAFEKDASLKGEFVRLVLSNNELSQDDKMKIIHYGLNALSGKGVNA